MRRWIIGGTIFGLVVSGWLGASPAQAFAPPQLDQIEAPVPSEDEGTELKPARAPALETAPIAPAETAPTQPAPAEAPAEIAPQAEAQSAREAPAAPAMQSTQTELPGLAIESILPGHTQVGIPFTATLKITNRGNAGAELVTMALPIPQQAEVLDATPKAESIQQGVMRFSLGGLPAGEQKIIQLKLNPKVAGPIALKARLASIASAPIAVEVRQAKLEAQFHGAPRIAFGETAEWKLVIANRGNGTADKVAATFQYPTDSVEIRTREAVQDLGAIAPGEQREIHLRLSGRRSGQHPIQVAVGGQFLAPIKAGQGLEVGLPSVKIQATGPESISLNKQAIYSLVLQNPCDRPLDQVQVVASLPAGLKVVAIDRDAVLDDVKRQLYWQLPRLAASGKETLNLKVEATLEGPQAMQVAVRAGAGPTTQANHVAEVISRADLRMVVAGTEDSVQLGGTAEMTVVVQNTGSRDAGHVVVHLQLPPGLAAQDGIDYSVEGNDVTFAPTIIRASQKLVLKCKVVGKATGDQVVRATLKAEGLPQLTSEDSVHFHEARNVPGAPRR